MNGINVDLNQYQCVQICNQSKNDRYRIELITFHDRIRWNVCREQINILHVHINYVSDIKR
jgi:hypothetical protein